MTDYIHQGFDNDANLEYRDIVLNISFINNHRVDDLLGGSDLESRDILGKSLSVGMLLQYHIECIDFDHCGYMMYISGDNSSITATHSDFEAFVTNKLRSHFVSTNAALANLPNHARTRETGLIFAVENMTMNSVDAMEIETKGVDVFVIILCIFCALCLFISGISIGVILYHRKRQGSSDVVNCRSEAVVCEDQNRVRKQSTSVLGLRMMMPGDNNESVRRYSSSYNAEGQEGVIATGVGSSENEEGTPVQDDVLHSMESDS